MSNIMNKSNKISHAHQENGHPIAEKMFAVSREITPVLGIVVDAETRATLFEIFGFVVVEFIPTTLFSSIIGVVFVGVVVLCSFTFIPAL